MYTRFDAEIPDIISLNKTKAYSKFIVDVAKVFGSKNSNLTQEVEEMVDFEIELNKVKIKLDQTVQIILY